jgi:deoxyhypusine synthase
VDGTSEQMVYAEATSVLPLMASYVYHRGAWRKRRKRAFSRLFPERVAGK